jgi:hypothetical protein
MFERPARTFFDVTLGLAPDFSKACRDPLTRTARLAATSRIVQAKR